MSSLAKSNVVGDRQPFLTNRRKIGKNIRKRPNRPSRKRKIIFKIIVVKRRNIRRFFASVLNGRMVELLIRKKILCVLVPLCEIDLGSLGWVFTI